jgi:hypothetical protein
MNRQTMGEQIDFFSHINITLSSNKMPSSAQHLLFFYENHLPAVNLHLPDYEQETGTNQHFTTCVIQSPNYHFYSTEIILHGQPVSS